MGEKVRNANVRAVKQQQCSSIKQLHDFLIDLTKFNETKSNELKCVVKPVQSAGSDDVFLCKSIEETEIAFNRIFQKKNGLGLINESVLIQEFLGNFSHFYRIFYVFLLFYYLFFYIYIFYF